MTRLSSSAIEHSRLLSAIADYERRGPADFLRHYRFGEARSMFLLHNGRHLRIERFSGLVVHVCVLESDTLPSR
jgi:hypothetical protein